MTTRIRNGLSFAILDQTVVILDIHANRYFQLPRDLTFAFSAIVDGADHIVTPDDRKRLMSARILSDTVPVDRPNAPRPRMRPVRSSVQTDNVQWVRGAMVRAAMMKIATAGRLRMMRFDRVIDRLRTIKARSSSGSSGSMQVTKIISAFAASRQIWSDVERCLPSSMALAEAMWNAGVSVDLVLGVRLSPFQAHCWVQWDERILNDHIDHVATFSPILVL